MDTTAKPVAAQAEKQNQPGKKSMGKSAMAGFLSGAFIIFGGAVYYCISSAHTYEGCILAGAFAMIIGIAIRMRNSI